MVDRDFSVGYPETTGVVTRLSLPRRAICGQCCRLSEKTGLGVLVGTLSIVDGDTVASLEGRELNEDSVVDRVTVADVVTNA